MLDNKVLDNTELVMDMAKPIRATPELKGPDAVRFLRKMAEKQKSRITKREIALVRRITKMSI